MKSYDLMLTLAEGALAAVLFLLAGVAERAVSGKWRLCYAVPLIVCMAFACLFGVEKCMAGVYLASAVMLAGFFFDGRKKRRAACVCAFVCAFAAIPCCLLYGGYRAPDFVRDFEKGFDMMKRRYVLAEYKGVDWDALYEKYLPRFKEAALCSDSEANILAWHSFCAEFGDGHVMFAADDKSADESARRKVFGNDYGLSLMTLSDGRTVAVNVEEGSAPYLAGIRNGTEITLWNGMEPSAAAELSAAGEIMSFADRDNEAFYHTLLAAGTGGDEVPVEFADENGEKHTVSVPKLGDYYDRLNDTIDILNGGYDIGNLCWEKVDGDTVLFRIKSMMFDIRSYNTGDHSAMKEELRAEMERYKAEGCDKLVLDLRSNSGGSGLMVRALAELLSPEGEYYYVSDGLWDDKTGSYVRDPETGKYVPGKENTFVGENAWGGSIVILVNAASVSAADHLVKVMRGMDNVTVMGFTETNGSAQGVGSVKLESGVLTFSGSLLLDRDGGIFVDSGADRQSGNGVDVIVPFDEEAVRSLFDEGEDYLLNAALSDLTGGY